MNERLKWKVNQWLDFLYPRRAVCMGCDSKSGLERLWLCEDCRKALAKQWIGAKMLRGLDGAALAYHYQGPAGSMVRHLKYSGVTALAEPMADDMLSAYRQILPTGAQMVVPVPMHAKRKMLRGYNQSEVLAKVIADRLDLPLVDALARTRDTVQQARLEGEARAKNLKGAFCVIDDVKDQNILLIDDVYTTGATAIECAETLRNAGANNVYYLAFAMGGG